MRSRKSKTLATLVVAGLAVAACGSDDDGADDSSADATTADGSTSDGASSDLDGTLRVLIHQNPPGVEFMENFNAEFEAANPGVSVDMSVVNADDIPTVNQTRLNAGDIDVTTISVTGFANPVQPYMEGADTPYWQQLIEAGLVMDLSGQDFVDNYDQAAIDDGSIDGSVYSLNLGRTIYSGMFVEPRPAGRGRRRGADDMGRVGLGLRCRRSDRQQVHDRRRPGRMAGLRRFLRAARRARIPTSKASSRASGPEMPPGTTRRVKSCSRSTAPTPTCSTRNPPVSPVTPPPSVTRRATSPSVRWAHGTPARSKTAPSSSGRTSRSPEATMLPTTRPSSASTTWPSPCRRETPVEDIAMAYLAAFSEPDNYNAFANATNYLPTQPTATLDNTLGQATAPILQAGDFTVGFEQWWVGPKGAGQWANGSQAALWLYNGDFSDPIGAADQSQADLESGL